VSISSPPFAFKPENQAIIAPDFDIVILNEPLRAHHRLAPPRRRPGKLIPRTRYNGPLPRLDMLDMLARRST